MRVAKGAAYRLVVWDRDFLTWLPEALRRLPRGKIPMYHAATGLRLPAEDVAVDEICNNTRVGDVGDVGALVGSAEVDGVDMLEVAAGLPELARRWPTVCAEVWALVCGLRGDDADADTGTDTREVLEARAMAVLRCSRGTAEEVARRIVVARCMVAGHIPFVADAPPDETPEEKEDGNDYDAVLDDDCETPLLANVALVSCLIDGMAELQEVDDDRSYSRGRGPIASADDALEAMQSSEVEGVDVAGRRPEFLAQAELEEIRFDARLKEQMEALEYEDEDDEVAEETVVVRRRLAESLREIRPIKFAKLVAEVTWDINTHVAYDDRALGVLWDAARHFLDQLFDASAAKRRRRLGLPEQEQEQEQAQAQEQDEEDAELVVSDDETPTRTEPPPEDALLIDDIRAALPRAISRRASSRKPPARRT